MKKIHVYPHTHWDYEWYFTSNESIIQLVYHMDEVIKALEDGDLETYLLDGQLSILDEYIRFMPSNFERVKKLVEEGKLIIGPWYTQTDELIIDGESIARNLFYGIKSASKYGDYLKVGYLPDSFGQSKDMPKILNGFDIKRSIFWRGVSKDVCPNREFIWKGEDDSSLLVYNIKNGYFYGGNLIYTDDVEKVEKTILDGSQTDNILLPVGGDQRFVDFNLKERIKYYNDRTKNDFEYVESSCDKFFDELENDTYFNTRKWTASTVQMILQIMSGQAKKHLRSEPIPLQKDSILHKVVGLTHTDFVNEPGKDVLMLYVRPDSIPCQNAFSDIKTLAKDSAENDNKNLFGHFFIIF